MYFYRYLFLDGEYDEVKCECDEYFIVALQDVVSLQSSLNLKNGK